MCVIHCTYLPALHGPSELHNCNNVVYDPIGAESIHLRCIQLYIHLRSIQLYSLPVLSLVQ